MTDEQYDGRPNRATWSVDQWLANEEKHFDAVAAMLDATMRNEPGVTAIQAGVLVHKYVRLCPEWPGWFMTEFGVSLDELSYIDWPDIGEHWLSIVREMKGRDMKEVCGYRIIGHYCPSPTEELAGDTVPHIVLGLGSDGMYVVATVFSRAGEYAQNMDHAEPFKAEWEAQREWIRRVMDDDPAVRWPNIIERRPL